MRLVREYTVRKHQVRREVVFSCIKKLHAAPQGEYAHSSTNPESSAHPTRGGQIFELSQITVDPLSLASYFRGILKRQGKRNLCARSGVIRFHAVKPDIQEAVDRGTGLHFECSRRGRVLRSREIKRRFFDDFRSAARALVKHNRLIIGISKFIPIVTTCGFIHICQIIVIGTEFKILCGWSSGIRSANQDELEIFRCTFTVRRTFGNIQCDIDVDIDICLDCVKSESCDDRLRLRADNLNSGSHLICIDKVDIGKSVAPIEGAFCRKINLFDRHERTIRCQRVLCCSAHVCSGCAVGLSQRPLISAGVLTKRHSICRAGIRRRCPSAWTG